MTQQNFRADSFVEGLAIKAPVRTTTSAPVVLQGEQLIGFVNLVVGDRILVKDQVDPIENGIYVVQTSAWTRAGDFDGSRDVVGGTLVPAYDPVNSDIVLYRVGGQSTPLEPNVDAMNFSIFYDPSAAGGVMLPVSTVEHSSLSADNSGGWIENSGILLDGNELFVDYVSALDNLQLGTGTGLAKRITSTGNLEIVAQGGVGSVSVIGGSNFQVIQGGSLYNEEKAAANLDLVGYGQYWVRDDAPCVPMFTDDTGVDYQLNLAPTFSPPLVLLDDEQIEFGTAAPDVTMEFDSGINGILIDPIAINTPFALNNAMGFRLHNQNGSGYIQFRNDGLLAFNDLQITAVGGTSNITVPFGIPIDLDNNRLLRPVLDDYAIQHQTAGSVAGTLDIDFEDGNSVFVELTENVTTVNLQNPPASGRLGQVEIEILQDSVARTITWPASVQWPGGTAPDLSTTNSTHLIHLRTRDGGTTYLGTFTNEFS